MENNKVSLRNRFCFGFGCIGRDVAYTLVSNFILVYLTLAVGLEDWQLYVVGIIMVAARVWDAINDPMMGTIIDRTHTKWGKFKPFIITGAILNSVFIILLFSDFNIGKIGFLVMFGFTYVMWGMTYTVNDISYWSMLPSLTTDPKEREKTSAIARIGANLGLFIVTALVPVITQIGNMGKMYKAIAYAAAFAFVACQVLVVLGVKETPNEITDVKSTTGLKDMVKVIFKNDQLLAIVLCILLFNIGYFTTTGFGVQFFYFDYGVYGGMEFTVFALVIGVTQILTLSLYPIIAKNLNRKQLFKMSIIMVIAGYIGFMCVGYILPMNMLVLGIIGFVLFAGQAIIQLLILVLLADTIEYGQWKLGTRNESIIFSLNPFVTKLSGAIQAGVISITLGISGLNKYSNQIAAMENDASLTKEQVKIAANELIATIMPYQKLILRASMMIVPLILIIASYVVYTKKYRIDDKLYAQIISDLKHRAKQSSTETEN